MAAAAARPDSVKQLRACIKCRLIKTYEQVRPPPSLLAGLPVCLHPPSTHLHSHPTAQFKLGYCENCRSNRPARDTEGMRADWVASNTTPDYEGCVRHARLPAASPTTPTSPPTPLPTPPPTHPPAAWCH